MLNLPGGWPARGLKRGLNAILREVLARRRLVGGRGISVTRTPGGLAVAARRDTPPVWATLSGAASPYSWEECAWEDGLCVADPGGLSGASDAYEVNDVPGLSGRVDLLRPTPFPDEWRFQAIRMGGYCGTIAYYPKGCDGTPLVALKGCAVTFNGSTQTVDNACNPVVFPIPGPGTYAVTFRKSRFQTLADSQVISSADCAAGVVIDGPVLSPAAGYHCGGTITGCCQDPFPDTLHVTDAYGSTTLTWGLSDAGAYPGWYGCQMATGVAARDNINCLADETDTLPIFYSFSVDGPGGGCLLFSAGMDNCTPGGFSPQYWPTINVSRTDCGTARLVADTAFALFANGHGTAGACGTGDSAIPLNLAFDAINCGFCNGPYAGGPLAHSPIVITE